MIFIELIASIFECFVIAEFTSKCLVFKNDQYTGLIFLIYTAILIFTSLFLPRVMKSNIAGVFQILVTFVFGLLFMNGSVPYTLFIALLVNIGIIIINVSVMAAFSHYKNLNFNDLIANRTSTRIWILFITKIAFFLYTRLMLMFFGQEKFPLSTLGWYIVASVLAISLVVMLVIFGINLRKKVNPKITAISTSLVIIINVAVCSTILLA